MKDTSKKAFPCVCDTVGGRSFLQEGLSLREYYAGQALAGLLASGSKWNGEKSTAKIASRHADALIAELEGGE